MWQCTDAFIYSSALDPVVSLDALTQSNEGGPRFDYPDPSPGPDEQVELQQASAAISAFIASLSPRDREIALAVCRGETQTAVAERYGVSKMAISKAMAKISAKGQHTLAPYRYLTLN